MSLPHALKPGRSLAKFVATLNALPLADFFLSGWEGAVLRAKSTRTTKPIDNFIELTFAFMAV
jgi:hypothetical protein